MIVWKKTYRQLQRDHEQLRAAFHENLRDRPIVLSFFDVLKKTLNTDLSWFDYNELSKTEMEKYYMSAQRILAEPIFQNEMNFLKSNWGKQAILDSSEILKKDIADHVQKMSWLILGIEMFRTRLESIQNPHTPNEKPKNPFSAL